MGSKLCGVVAILAISMVRGVTAGIFDFKERELTDFGLSAPDLISSRGYECEIHKIVTEDNYILTLHRVINPKKQINKSVFMNHGFADASDVWLAIDTEGDLGDGHVTDKVDRELAFALARRGYDVWLANWRGNKYSNEHSLVNTSSAEYWRFTLDQIFTYDIQAMVNYVLKTTELKRIAYIGHSEGCTAGLVLMNQYPKMADKLKPFIALAPYLGNKIQSIAGFFSSPLMADPLYHFFTDEPRQVLNFPRFPLCIFPIAKVLCVIFAYIAQAYLGKHTLFEKTYNTYTFYGTSSLAVAHNIQILTSGELRHFKYSDDETNQEHYGSKEPPFYYPANSSNQYVAVFHSKDDGTAQAAKVKEFIKEYRG
ncbi:Lysosomal acid lipase/cholesteryl ester hydrolase [Halotydeus destructor]|nr:Lysosomal acid lipase/cholesteryl ester hydrolase [Halotydeus destructor]